MKRRPPVILVLLLLVAGAIVNVAVAWGCCLYGFRHSRDQLQLRRAPTPQDLALWRSLEPPTGIREPHEIWPTMAAGYRETRYLGTGPVVTRTNGDQVQITSSANSNTAGWPFAALGGVWFGIPDSNTGGWTHELRGAVKIDSQSLRRMFTKRASYFPWHPRWPGFAVNTLLYTLLLWMTAAGVAALRRRRRIKRGLCPKCAYPVGTNERCTECGATVNRIAR